MFGLSDSVKLRNVDLFSSNSFEINEEKNLNELETRFKKGLLAIVNQPSEIYSHLINEEHSNANISSISSLNDDTNYSSQLNETSMMLYDDDDDEQIEDDDDLFDDELYDNEEDDMLFN